MRRSFVARAEKLDAKGNGGYSSKGAIRIMHSAAFVDSIDGPHVEWAPGSFIYMPTTAPTASNIVTKIGGQD